MAKQTATEKSRTTKKPASSARPKKQPAISMPLQKENYLYIGIGVIVIIISYILMAMDSSVDGFISLTLCPILLIGSYLWIVYALVFRPTNEKKPSDAAPAN